MMTPEKWAQLKLSNPKEYARITQDAYLSTCEQAGQKLDRDAVIYLFTRGDDKMNIVAKLVNMR